MSGAVITALEVQKRNKGRVNVHLDGEYAFSLSLDEAARLRKGQTLSDAEVAALKGTDEVQRAVDSAARFLSVRPRSEAEVRKNLREKDVPDPVIDAALERLRALGYLDDAAFARYWVESRTQFNPISPKALRYELRQKGVSDAVIADVVETVDADDAVYRALEAQAKKTVRGSFDKRTRDRLVAALQRRGFSYADIRRALEQWQEAHPELIVGTHDDETWTDEG